MTYNLLHDRLRETADAARAYFSQSTDVSNISIEVTVKTDLELRPTLSGIDGDHYTVCIEVTDGRLTELLERFIEGCKAKNYPVKLWVAIPPAVTEEDQSNYYRLIKVAKEEGFGVIEVATKDDVFEHAQSLSLPLRGVKLIEIADFPKQYRGRLRTAQSTFIGGDPSNGCLELYKALESLTRRIAKKIDRKRAWITRPKINLDTDSWFKVSKEIADSTDTHKLRRLCPDLDIKLLFVLIDRVEPATRHRNTFAHEPSSQRVLTNRNEKLRIRFEAATDLLKELINATKPLL